MNIFCKKTNYLFLNMNYKRENKFNAKIIVDFIAGKTAYHNPHMSHKSY